MDVHPYEVIKLMYAIFRMAQDWCADKTRHDEAYVRAVISIWKHEPIRPCQNEKVKCKCGDFLRIFRHYFNDGIDETQFALGKRFTAHQRCELYDECILRILVSNFLINFSF